MDWILFIKSIGLGLAIAAPVGPIGILCIRKTLQYGRLSGLVSGLGAAVADACYASIAAFGLTYISDLMVAGQFWFRLLGGIFLIYLGWKTLIARPVSHLKGMGHTSFIKDFIETFFLTITNPMTILTFIALFAGLGFTNDHEGYFGATFIVFGVLIGSAFWWMLLSEGITLFRKKVNHQVMIWVNRIAGIIIVCFGMGAIFSLIFKK